MKTHPILVVGGSGQLGSALLRKASAPSLSRTFSPEFIGTYCRGSGNQEKKLVQLDIQNKDQVHTLIAQLKPRIIINTAAMTHVDACEQSPAVAESINVQGHLYLAEAAKNIGAKLVFISTYYVFDGTKGAYTEEDAPHPLNVYARTKVRGEEITLKVPGSLVIRPSKIYSLHYDQRNFLARLVRQFQQGEKIRVTNDQYTNPISTEDAATAILCLIEGRASGIYHVGGPMTVSNDGFAQLVAAKYGYNTKLLVPLSTEEFAAPALRPKNCSLDAQKLYKETGLKTKSIEENLQEWKGKRVE